MAIYVGDLFMRLGGVAYYTPTFARGGLGISIQFNIFALSATGITITIEHKNIEDTVWASLTAATFSATGLTAPLASGPVKEQVRIKYVVNGASDEMAVYVNTLAPVWQPYP